MKAVRTVLLVVVAVLLAVSLTSCGRMRKVSGIVGSWTGTPRTLAPGMSANQVMKLKINKDETCELDANGIIVKGTWTLENDALTVKLTSDKPSQPIPDMKLKLSPDLHTLRYDGEIPGGGKFTYVFLKPKK